MTTARIPWSRFGEVAKRSNAADCKSVALAASKVRVLPSPPIGRKAREHRSSIASGGGSNSVVESQPSKLLVAGSIPVSRSTTRAEFSHLLIDSSVKVGAVNDQ